MEYEDLHYQQDGTGIEHKYSESEGKMYVRRYAANHDAIAEEVQKVRNQGGTKTRRRESRRKHSGRDAVRGRAGHDVWRSLQGILSADAETRCSYWQSSCLSQR